MKPARSVVINRGTALVPIVLVVVALAACTQHPTDAAVQRVCEKEQVRELESELEHAGHPGDAALDPVRDDLYEATILCEKSPRTADADMELGEIAAELFEPDRGFTWDPGSGEIATSGFAVSPYPERSVTIESIPSLDPADVEEAIESFATQNADLLDDDDAFLGGWHDPDTGTVWLDVAVVTDSAGEARAIGVEEDQLAFFDFQMLESVDIELD